MKIRFTNYIFIIGLLIFAYSCEKAHIVEDGMKPVYYSYDDFSELRSGLPIQYGDLSKIVAAGNYVFINEVGKGIHVIDNTNPVFPIQIYFWHIMGNTEFTINNNVLYANNGKHLLTIDISDFANISLIKVIKDQYDPEDLELYPEGYSGYFECYDGKKGILLRWERGLIRNPYCQTN